MADAAVAPTGGAAPREDDLSDAAPRRGRSLRIAGAVGFVVVVIAVVAAALRARSVDPIEVELGRMRAAGLPTTQLAVYGADPPASENGALDLQAAYDALAGEDGGNRFFKGTGPWDTDTPEPWYDNATPEQTAALRALLEQERAFFDRVDAALAKPRFRFPPALHASGRETGHFVQTLQRTGQILAARAAAAETPADRIAGLSAVARLGRRTEPTLLIDAIVGAGIVGTAVREARRAVEGGSLPAADVRRALDPHLRASFAPLLPKVAPAEAVNAATMYRCWRDGTIGTTGPPPTAWERFTDGLPRMVKSLFRRPERTLTEALFDGLFQDVGSEDVAAAMRAWLEIAAVDGSSIRSLRAGVDAIERRIPAGPVRRLIDPSITGWDVLAEARCRLARVALAVKERHDASGAWPASLDELRDEFEGAIPLDPCSDAPFVYMLGDATVRVRAAGLPGDTPPDDETLREQVLLWEFRK